MIPARFVGCDVGGQSLKLAVVDADGKIVSSTSQRTGPGTDLAGLAQAVRAGLDEVSTSLEDQRRPSILGLGVPGVLDRQGFLDGCPNLPLLTGVKIGAELGKLLGLSVQVDNDANCAALGEGWSGAAQDVCDYLHLTLGTGLGSGLVLRGQIHQGQTGHGCELGHMVVRYQGRPCVCGGRGCLEAYASENGMRLGVAEAGSELQAAIKQRSALAGQAFAEALFSLAADGDPAAVSFVDEAIDLLGAGIASAVNILDLEVVIVGGGMGDAVLAREARLRASMDQALFARAGACVALRGAVHRGLAGAVGAARLAHRHGLANGGGSP